MAKNNRHQIRDPAKQCERVIPLAQLVLNPKTKSENVMKNLIKLTVVLSLLVIVCLLIGACGDDTEQFVQGQGQIDITVTNSVSSALLSGVTIEVRETSGGAVRDTFFTDANGYYKFLGTVGTDYFFTFSKSGYATSVQYTKTPQLTSTGTLSVALVPVI